VLHDIPVLHAFCILVVDVFSVSFRVQLTLPAGKKLLVFSRWDAGWPKAPRN